MATPGKPVKDTKKKTPTKTSFSSPFTSTWSPLPQEDMVFILKTLKDKLISTGLEKREVKVFRPWRKNKGQRPAATPEAVPQESPDKQERDPVRNGWTDVGARRQLAIGINEVTKALERNELQLLLVCKSVRPKYMTNHLMALSATRGVPACQVPCLSKSVSEWLGLKSVLALGFKRCFSTDEMFRDTVDAIKLRVPSINLTWLHGTGPRKTPKHHTGAEVKKGEAGKMRGQKRKLEGESEEVREAPSSCTLEPLKVKRIVANPAKKRKRKVKKKTGK